MSVILLDGQPVLIRAVVRQAERPVVNVDPPEAVEVSTSFFDLDVLQLTTLKLENADLEVKLVKCQVWNLDRDPARFTGPELDVQSQ